MSVRILVMSDDETWEKFEGKVRIVEVTDEAYKALCNGCQPNALNEEDEVLGIYEVSIPLPKEKC